MDVTELLDRSAELKSALVDYATSPGFARRLAEALKSAETEGRPSMEEFADAVEQMLFEPSLDGREALLHRFLRTNKALSPDDRAVYEDWRDRNVLGAFRIVSNHRMWMVLHNLIDELDYQAHPTAGLEQLPHVKPGGYVVTRLVPVGGIWTVSGNLRFFGANDLPQVRRFAASLLRRMPQLAFRNPEKLENARDTVRKHHDIFVRLFGGNVLRGTGAEAVAAYRRFLDACGSELARPDTDPATIRTGAQLAPDSGIPPEILESADVALFHHPVKSISFLLHYGELEDAHRFPPRDTHDAGAVRGFVEDSTTPAYVLQELASRFPGTVNATYRVALSQPDFDWDRDGEALLRRHKPDSFREQDVPAISTVPALLVEEYRKSVEG
ncbi:hypothetical protein [Arthrobacter wenxiniae]|jgi:hypothetical protein|uniref:Uncharacterized protein n=1 Tax=Arthrobacter wenxiniae TaxID=2713570 RepID=A0A7Y7IHX5_9MICC|nr:hypothetical protein [Arthrobacter wenxiniae]NVM95810.1 hypothetical protein [Arthrobacter wenxiniae]